MPDRPLRADAQRNRDRLVETAVRAVSIPIPEAPPVTTARLPVRSGPAMTSSAVDVAVKGVFRIFGYVLAGKMGKRRNLRYLPPG